jgi:hypothetical protein
VDALFVRYQRLPFASGYAPNGELISHVVASGGLLLGSFTLAWIERFTLSVSPGYLMLVVTMIGLDVGIRALDRASRRPATPLDLDEPLPLPTQRLDLAS